MFEQIAARSNTCIRRIAHINAVQDEQQRAVIQQL